MSGPRCGHCDYELEPCESGICDDCYADVSKQSAQSVASKTHAPQVPPEPTRAAADNAAAHNAVGVDPYIRSLQAAHGPNCTADDLCGYRLRRARWHAVFVGVLFLCVTARFGIAVAAGGITTQVAWSDTAPQCGQDCSGLRPTGSHGAVPVG